MSIFNKFIKRKMIKLINKEYLVDKIKIFYIEREGRG
jgi:hypothetical protein